MERKKQLCKAWPAAFHQVWNPDRPGNHLGSFGTDKIDDFLLDRLQICSMLEVKAAAITAQSATLVYIEGE